MIPLSFKPLSIDHLNLLHKWMQQPHVHQWWSDGKSWSFNDIREKYTPYTLGYKIEQGEKKLIFPFVIEFENRPIGFIQYYNAFDFEREGFCVKEIWKDQNQSLAAIDFYIGEPDYIEKGLAPKALTSFLQQYVFNHFDACLVDPEKNNKSAIKCYAKAGFSPLQDFDSSIIMIAHREEIKKPLIYSTMKKIFFIIGASGSGKTTMVKEIERMMLPNFKTIYFDSIGVPSLEEMTQNYGGPEEWQKIKTVEWIEQIKQKFLPHTNVVFDGQTRPSFIEEGCISQSIIKYDVILLDCSDEERRLRLFKRGQKELADENMMNWARYLRKECKQRGHLIVDNTQLNEEETTSKLLACLEK